MSGRNETETLLEVCDLKVVFPSPRGDLRAVDGISYTVKKGEIMGLVGESGSGKSVEAFSILRLLKPPGRIVSGRVLFEGRDILSFSKRELEDFRGTEISMIFQDPLSCLDPVFTIERQMVETIRAHDKTVTKAQAREQAAQMLREVSIREPERILRQYPFELSGGMRQRVMIAIALLCHPKLLFADEPTPALDVTIQAQIVQIIKRLQAQTGMAVVYITHNFGLVAELCDRVSVMYGGYIMEQGTVDDIFYRAAHPYTRLLLETIPRMDTEKKPLVPIMGAPIDIAEPPGGCVFHPRCNECGDMCKTAFPPKTVLGPEHSASCWKLSEKADADGGSV